MRQLLLYLQIFFFLSACGDPNGGSVVGNSAARYVNPVYKYSFQYFSSLELDQETPELVTLNNQPSLAAIKEDNVSTLSFTIERGNLKDQEAIKKKYTKTGLGPWQRILRDRFDGWVQFDEQRDSRTSREIIFLNETHMMIIDTKAFKEGEGIKQFEEVLKSLTIDNEPPQIHEIKFSPSEVNAGDKVTLLYRATDNFGEVFSHDSTGSAGVGRYPCRNLTAIAELSGHYVTRQQFCERHKKLKGDWYKVTFTINPYLPAGDYDLGQGGRLTFVDGADNPVTVYSPVLRVHNTKGDMTSPYIVKSSLDKKVARPGETVRLTVDVRDDDSGLAELESQWFSLKSPVHKGQSAWIHSNNPTKTADGKLVYDIKIPSFAPPGIYQTELRYRDQVFNHLWRWEDRDYTEYYRKHKDVAVLRLEIVNDGEIDQVAPELLETKFSKTEAAPGDTVEFMFRLTDQSQIDFGHKGGVCWALIDKKERYSSTKAPSEFIKVCPILAKSLGDGWYTIPFKIPGNTPRGDYLVNRMNASDELNNYEFYVVNRKTGYWMKNAFLAQVSYAEIDKDWELPRLKPTNIKAPYLKVVR
jgi:hypothetical protein